MEYQESQAKIFKVLMHPVRLAILDLLRESEQCVCHMEAATGLRQAYISQHLMIMREAGLVQDRRDGWNIFYRVIEPRIYAVIDAASQLAENNNIPGRANSTRISRQIVCDCPKCKTEANILVAQE
jgi:DNA-binding transcriptional ArsR family regulator